MRKIVREILETESRVDAILKEARQRALEMRRSAEKEMSETISDARRQAREIVQVAVEEAKKEAERIREETLRNAEAQQTALLDGMAEAIDGLVARICAVIRTTECQTDDQ
jgi:vacuolar-type H+-ATPase subunit H